MKIAIQGEPGSFSHEAALKLVPGAEIVPCALSAEVFAALDAGAADAAVIPIENSLAGSVLEHFDLLLAHDVKVVRETLLRIRHNLIAHCRRDRLAKSTACFRIPWRWRSAGGFWPSTPQMKAIAFYDTAGSVKQLVELRDQQAAAIASEAAAHDYGAEILAAGIEDNPENYTRFFLVRPSGEAETDPAAEQDEHGFFAGASARLAGGGAERALSALGTNLTKIESRPVQGKPWEYIFYVDCQIRAPGGGCARPGGARARIAAW